MKKPSEENLDLIEDLIRRIVDDHGILFICAKANLSFLDSFPANLPSVHSIGSENGESSSIRTVKFVK